MDELRGHGVEVDVGDVEILRAEQALLVVLLVPVPDPLMCAGNATNDRTHWQRAVLRKKSTARPA